MKPILHSFDRSILAAAMLAVLTACTVSPTPYQVEGENGGYSEQQIEEDRYSVKFVGNSATPRDTVEEYALFRAAEVTLENGHDYFKVVSREIEPVVKSSSGVYPRVGVGLGGGNVGLGVSTGFGSGRADYSYAAYLDIVVYDGDKPDDDRDAYVALDVIDNLKAKIAANTPKPEE
ncbi:MAG: CC0125/CC1285 family lipoprotein [Geminicoccaceae bacterium]|jgi:hypothetical protein